MHHRIWSREAKIVLHLLAKHANDVLNKAAASKERVHAVPPPARTIIKKSAKPVQSFNVSPTPGIAQARPAPNVGVAETSKPSPLEAAPTEQTLGMPADYEPFAIGSLGYFPYYWQDPANLKFNAKTYNWINSALKPATDPLEQDGLFTNVFIDAFTKVSYKVSTTEQNERIAASHNIIAQQASLLQAWTAAGYKLTGSQPIDGVIKKIEQEWASPPTTFKAMKSASRLQALLNATPPSGLSVLPVLENYIDAINSYDALVNNATMNASFLAAARQALLSAAPSNGGLAISSGDIVPAFQISPTPNEIATALARTDRTFEMTLKVARKDENTYQVTPTDDAPYTIKDVPLLTLTEANGGIQRLNLAVGDLPARATFIFTGVTEVFFGPCSFSKSAQKYWYWVDPVREAVKHGTKDVTGFRFDPAPQIDFSNKGPFGYLVSVAIAQHPQIKIEIGAENVPSIQSKASTLQSRSGKVSFLGHEVAEIGGGEDEVKLRTNTLKTSTKGVLELAIAPDAQLVASTVTDKTAFVLGARSCFPIAE